MSDYEGSAEIVPAGQGAPANGPAAGIVRREDFGGVEIARQAETAIGAAAEQARALVEASYLVALRRPRDLDAVRVAILKEVSRPGMAEAAIYRKPQGRRLNEETGRWEDAHVEGPSVRFVEAALRLMGNIDQTSMTIYDDGQKRIVRVAVTDLETNTRFSKDVTIEKTVERSDAKGRTVIASRMNSKGRMTYTVSATDDELLAKENSLVSKTLRNNGGRLLPGDIREEALAKAREVRLRQDTADPDAARKRIADSFVSIGVMPDDLAKYLGHPLAQCSPAEREDLRGIFAAIRDGDVTWKQVLETRQSEGDEKAVAETKEKIEKSANDLKARAAAKAADAKARKVAEQKPKEEQAQQAMAANDDAPRGREPGEEG